ncbi:MAG: hypothetical protein JWN78_578 [Bacteroidota bacterium]|nr:hypothetical protein [Bacteroidota bacterium]
MCISLWSCKKKHDCTAESCKGSLNCDESSYTGSYGGYIDFQGGGDWQSDEQLTIQTGSNTHDGILEVSSRTFGSFKIILDKNNCGKFSFDSTSVSKIGSNLIGTNTFYNLHSFVNSGYFDGCSECGANVLQFFNSVVSDSSEQFGYLPIGISFTGTLTK